MSLITRCPACGTMFKVVADQLKISQGWVRCGQCAEVFDAAAHLQPRVAAQLPVASVPEETYTPPGDSPAYVAAEATASFSTLLRAPEVETPAAAPSPLPQEPSAPPLAERPQAPLSVPEVQAAMPPDQAADVFASSLSLDATEAVEPPLKTPPANPALAEPEAAEPVPQEVSFVRDARRQAFWRQPAMRAVLGAAALLLLLVLLLQVAVFQRNALAVRHPGLQGTLQTLCGYLRCEIAPLRRIDSMVIESSSFYKITPDTYQLKVVIKNTSALTLALPSLELTLTGVQDQALLRRVLTPAELGAGVPTLAAGAEFAGMLHLAVSDTAALLPPSASAALPKASAPLRIAGYNLHAFYP